MFQTTATSTTRLSASQQHLLATPLGRQFGPDVLKLEALFPGAQLSEMAESLGRRKPPRLCCTQTRRLFSSKWRDTRNGEAAKIKLRPIPTTDFAIRQYQLENIGSHPEEVDRQAFLLDFYDTAREMQLSPVPKGYTFSARSHKMLPVVLGPHGTTIAVRGVQFEVKRGSEVLLEFIARDL
ncbi:hypothetical protein C8R45DRAFT_1075854 [Mycena sanguinolenta]|nr:hypothetical protein C8R45DRAFT_1075854 [Mycena sanguinolenta]